jgi:hypothetical protein
MVWLTAHNLRFTGRHGSRRAGLVLLVTGALGGPGHAAAAGAEIDSRGDTVRYTNTDYGVTLTFPGDVRVCSADPPQPNHGALSVPAGQGPCPDRLQLAEAPAQSVALALEYNVLGLNGEAIRRRDCDRPAAAMVTSRLGQYTVCQQEQGEAAIYAVNLQISTPAERTEPYRWINLRVATKIAGDDAAAVQRLTLALNGLQFSAGRMVVEGSAK